MDNSNEQHRTLQSEYDCVEYFGRIKSYYCSTLISGQYYFVFMSNLLTESIVIYRRLEQVYRDSIHETLKTPEEKLKAILNELLESKSTEYFLRKKNSVYDNKYYYVKSRVKNPDSFYEKLIRKELGMQLVNSLGLHSTTEDVVNLKKAEVVSTIQKLDDIIGVRIVTELKKDCTQVYDLLQNSADVFLKNEIVFSNLDVQPEKMRNGLDIFRLKGVFQNLYGFELQIKSKIEETWGDLDHTLFYKDYSISPIKDTVQITMNNVGILLDKIEKLLFDLRESGDTYNINAEKLQIQIELEKELTPFLKASCGVNYNVKEISFYLFYFKSKLGITDKKLTDLNFDYLNIPINDQKVKDYIKIRNNSLVLTIMEGIYINWSSLAGIVATGVNIDQLLLDYISLISAFLSEQLTIDSEEFSPRIDSLIKYESSAEIFLNPGRHKKIIGVSNRVNEILSDQYEQSEHIEHVKRLYEIEYFDGDTKRLLDEIDDGEFDYSGAIIFIKEQVVNSTDEKDLEISNLSTMVLEKLTV